MKIKDKMKSYGFWISLASAIILILKVIGAKFGFSVDETFISDLTTSLCSILVILGIIVTPSSKIETLAKMVEQETKLNNTTLETDECSTHEKQVPETEDATLITTEDLNEFTQEKSVDFFINEEPVINKQTEESSEATIQIEIETIENNNQENDLREFLEKHINNISTDTENYIKILEESIQKLKDNKN